MLPCPSPWEYKDHSEYPRALQQTAANIIRSLRNGRIDTLEAVTDTTHYHHSLFRALTPRNFAIYAGNYRGCGHRCLKNYEVQIRSDLRVGVHSSQVSSSIDTLASAIQKIVTDLDEAYADTNSPQSPEEKLKITVALTCWIMVKFLTIHPYANGNGHIARFILVAIMSRYGYWPNRFPMEPSPDGYQYRIAAYRSGNTVPFEEYIFSCIDPQSP